MSVEQTSQLIQLILNSVLLVTACMIALGCLLVRHATVNDRLKATQENYFASFSSTDMFGSDRLLYLKHRLWHLRHRYRTAYRSVLAVQYALFFAVGSTLTMALRTLLARDWLISVGLLLFILSIGVLLVGVGFALLDFHAASRPLWDELGWIVNTGKAGKRELKLEPRSKRPLPARRLSRSSEQPALPAGRRNN